MMMTDPFGSFECLGELDGVTVADQEIDYWQGNAASPRAWNGSLDVPIATYVERTNSIATEEPQLAPVCPPASLDSTGEEGWMPALDSTVGAAMATVAATAPVVLASSSPAFDLATLAVNAANSQLASALNDQTAPPAFTVECVTCILAQPHAGAYNAPHCYLHCRSSVCMDFPGQFRHVPHECTHSGALIKHADRESFRRGHLLCTGVTLDYCFRIRPTGSERLPLGHFTMDWLGQPPGNTNITPTTSPHRVDPQPMSSFHSQPLEADQHSCIVQSSWFDPRCSSISPVPAHSSGKSKLDYPETISYDPMNDLAYRSGRVFRLVLRWHADGCAAGIIVHASCPFSLVKKSSFVARAMKWHIPSASGVTVSVLRHLRPQTHGAGKRATPDHVSPSPAACSSSAAAAASSSDLSPHSFPLLTQLPGFMTTDEYVQPANAQLFCAHVRSALQFAAASLPKRHPEQLFMLMVPAGPTPLKDLPSQFGFTHPFVLLHVANYCCAQHVLYQRTWLQIRSSLRQSRLLSEFHASAAAHPFLLALVSIIDKLLAAARADSRIQQDADRAWNSMLGLPDSPVEEAPAAASSTSIASASSSGTVAGPRAAAFDPTDLQRQQLMGRISTLLFSLNERSIDALVRTLSKLLAVYHHWMSTDIGDLTERFRQTKFNMVELVETHGPSQTDREEHHTSVKHAKTVAPPTAARAAPLPACPDLESCGDPASPCYCTLAHYRHWLSTCEAFQQTEY